MQFAPTTINNQQLSINHHLQPKPALFSNLTCTISAHQIINESKRLHFSP